MDDGKVNVLGPTMQQALNDALDNADRDDAGAVVIAGNDRVFSGGFDLKVLTSGEIAARDRHAQGRLRTFPSAAVLPQAGGDGLHRPRHRDGRISAGQRRSPNCGSRRQHSGQRSRDRYDDPLFGAGGDEAAPDPVGLSASRRAGEDVLRRNRGRRRLARRNRVARHGAQPRRGSRAGIRHAQAARPCRDETADSGRCAAAIRAGIDNMAAEFEV